MTRSPDEVDVVIGKNLRKLRGQRGLSLEAIGRVIGTTYQQVQKYEVGRNRISARNLYVLARFLEVEIVALFEGLETAAPAPEISSTAAQLARIAHGQQEVAQALCLLACALARLGPLDPS